MTTTTSTPTKHDNSSDGDNNDSFKSTDESEINVSNISDLFVSQSVHNNLLKLKCEYIRHVQKLDEHTDSDILNSSSFDFLLCDQVEKTVRKTLLKNDVADMYLSLLNFVRPLCLSTYKVDKRPKPLPQEVQIQSILTKVENSHVNITDIQAQLTSLQSSVDSFKRDDVRSYEDKVYDDQDFGKFLPLNNNNVSFNDQCVKDQISKIEPVDDNIPNYLGVDDIKKLKSFCDGCNFTEENGHGTIKFGESYNYNGSRNDSIPTPAIVEELMGRLNDQFVKEGAQKLNSCLINRYEGPESSIKQHSDNEREIACDSNIYTVSIGHSRTINFVNSITGDTPSLRVDSGSMYSMTRLSQEFFEHRIDADEEAADVRYSLTFRSVSWRNHNCTILIGDSNTNNVKFGGERGTLGISMPGKRVEGFIIDQINPLDCVAYNNIILHCGVNNIKSKHINSPKDISDVYVQFKSKVQDIRLINKRAKILISPVLPTRLRGLNDKILAYNKLIFDDLVKSSLRIHYVTGYDNFVGDDRCLSVQNARYNDYLHLNSSGVRFLASCMKACVLRKTSTNYSGKQRSGDLYSSKVKGGVRRPA